MVYGAPVNKGMPATAGLATTYVDDELVLQGREFQRYVTQRLQETLNQHIDRGPTFKVRWVTAKVELKDMEGGTTAVKRYNTPGQLYNTAVTLSDHLNSLGVWIADRVSFKQHIAFSSSHARSSIGQL